ncbi:MAG: hypothetical protein AAF414_09490 [Pseudomonadota bacterium]
MTFRQALCSAAFPILILSSAAASAQSEAECAPFTAFSNASERTVYYVDAGADGPGPGDQRIGRRTLVDGDGNQIGYFRWVGTVLDVPGDDGQTGETLFDEVLVFEHGLIMAQSLDTTTVPAQDTNQVTWATVQPSVVFGGTGPYDGAVGTISYSRDDLVLTLTVDISCGD